jgi:Na+-transporting NADH:ubiquinone oxidoreductase subunit F
VLLTLPIRAVVPGTPRARIVRLDLGDRVFAYAPGQAVLVAAHGEAKRKPYSIAASPEDAARDRWIELLVGIDDQSMVGSHVPLHPGALVDVEGPVGSFTFPSDPPERRFLFIAGGTGIAPLRAMLRHALAIPHREVGLLYSARTPDDFAYEQELRELARERRIELRQTITRTGGDAAWAGGRGRIGRAELAPLVHDPATLCFVCGPQTLVNGTTKLLQELGVPRQRIRVEEWLGTGG